MLDGWGCVSGAAARCGLPIECPSARSRRRHCKSRSRRILPGGCVASIERHIAVVFAAAIGCHAPAFAGGKQVDGAGREVGGQACPGRGLACTTDRIAAEEEALPGQVLQNLGDDCAGPITAEPTARRSARSRTMAFSIRSRSPTTIASASVRELASRDNSGKYCCTSSGSMLVNSLWVRMGSCWGFCAGR